MNLADPFKLADLGSRVNRSGLRRVHLYTTLGGNHTHTDFRSFLYLNFQFDAKIFLPWCFFAMWHLLVDAKKNMTIQSSTLSD